MYIKRSHEDFLNHFKSKQPELFTKIKILDEFKNSQTKLLVQDKYGICLVAVCHLIKGKTPSIVTAIDKNEYFKNKILEINPNFFTENELLSNYVNNHTSILVKTKEFTIKKTPASLLHNPFSIQEDFKNNHDFFVRRLIKLNPNFFKNFTLISKYKDSDTKIIFQSKYGLHALIPTFLYKIKKPRIQSALDKTHYFITVSKLNQKKEYDYSISEFIHIDQPIKIICKKHGVFEQRPSSHMKGFGCSLCGNIDISNYKREHCSSFNYTSWIEKSKNSKNFDSFKIYIIKCWNETETFYKIGKTSKTVKDRFYSKKSMPYNYKIIKTIENSGEIICKIERSLHKYLYKNKYKPFIKFDGMYECFSSLKFTEN